MNPTSHILSVTVADFGSARNHHRRPGSGLRRHRRRDRGVPAPGAPAVAAARPLMAATAPASISWKGWAATASSSSASCSPLSSLGVNLSTWRCSPAHWASASAWACRAWSRNSSRAWFCCSTASSRSATISNCRAAAIVRGEVMEIGARATRIKSNDNIDILVPNSRLIEERFINWTLEGQTRRIHVPFSVAYGADKALVRDVVIAAAKGISATLPDDGGGRTQVWLVGFGDSALNFELVVWPTLEAVKRPATMHAAYTWAIDDALRAAGIEIPFPQRDIRLRSMFGREGDAGLRASARRLRPGPCPPRKRPMGATMLPTIFCSPSARRCSRNKTRKRDR